VIVNKKVKGLVVGYPLDKEKKEIFLSSFIVDLLNFVKEVHRVKVPITLVDETDTTMEAKVQIMKVLKG
jgi:RNase H-fold protein (predicted Holliday junction resolvase)